MRRALHFLPFAFFLIACTLALQGQPSELYNGFPTQLQTRNIPAGTVVDPGSSLIYIIDTGANLREAVGANLTGYNAPLSVVDQGPRDGAGNFIAPNPFGVGGSRSIYNPDGSFNSNLVNRNFITITNTHPTAGVTVHFRYFNDECVDVLDFLVLLTCNDTLLFDPFDFNIPGSDFNTQTRIFGPRQGAFSPIRAADFASGRFVIFATAAGTSYEPANAVGIQDDNAELRFPHEFMGYISDDNHCTNLRDNTYFGLASGLRQNNLHVFNASAVAFNYLIGNWTTAVPFGNVFQAWGINAWTRPAVDLTVDDVTGNQSYVTGEPDGDGPPLLDGNDFRILTGNEIVRAANDGLDANPSLDQVQINSLYLRNDVHGGDTSLDFIDGDGVRDFDSFNGALGATSIYGTGPNGTSFYFFSAIDDYNGSRHSSDSPVAGLVDRSYNLNGATTTYVLQIYDNDETLFDVTDRTPINISPPPFEGFTAVLKITVDCLRVWITDIKSTATSVDTLTITDLGGIADGLVDFLTKAVNPKVDASQGWIRFVRDNSIFRSDGTTGLFGTWALAGFTHDSATNASFVTIGQQVTTAGGFGVSWWLSSAASLPLVSITGDPQCNGACPAPTVAVGN